MNLLIAIRLLNDLSSTKITNMVEKSKLNDLSSPFSHSGLLHLSNEGGESVINNNSRDIANSPR